MIPNPPTRIDWARTPAGDVDTDDPANVEKVIADSGSYFDTITHSDIDDNPATLQNTIATCTYRYGWTPSADAARQALKKRAAEFDIYFDRSAGRWIADCNGEKTNHPTCSCAEDHLFKYLAGIGKGNAAQVADETAARAWDRHVNDLL